MKKNPPQSGGFCVYKYCKTFFIFKNQYNYLNLPKKITQNTQVTDYVYRADGVKVKKFFNDLETDYLDGFQYKFTYAWEDETGTMTTDGMKLRDHPYFGRLF